MEELKESVRICIFSARVLKAKPISLVIISRPEQGKTETVLTIVGNGLSKHCPIFTDITAKGFDRQMRRKQYTHLIINDMTFSQSHKDSVKKGIESRMMAISEDGVFQVSDPSGDKKFDGTRKGLIICTTDAQMNDRRNWWIQNGLASRMLPFYFQHSDKLTLRIFDEIDKCEDEDKSRSHSEHLKIKLPTHSTEINYPLPLRSKVRELGIRKAAQMNEVGYRRLRQFHCFVRASALMHGRTRVTEQDYKFLLDIQPFIKFGGIANVID